MRSKKISIISIALLLTVTLVFLAGGCATRGKSPQNVNCPAKFKWEIAPEAEITRFDCVQETRSNIPTLTFNTEVKNTTAGPLRYRINIFLLDQDKGAGALIPRKGKPPVIAAGESAKVSIPFFNTETASEDILVKVMILQ